MKVALVIRRFAAGGGAERACAGLARGLLSRGHEVHVFANAVDPLPGVVPHPVPMGGLLPHASFAANSRRLLDAERFDVIHSFTRTPFQDILRLGGGIHREYLARTDAVRSAAGRWWRTISPKERCELELERESLQQGHIVAVSKRVREEAMRHYGIPGDRISVIYNGVDAAVFKPDPAARARLRGSFGVREEEYVLLFCGSGFRRKGLDFAVAAVDRVPGARLWVIGEGSARPHPRVAMLGRREDVPGFYAAADALILPTLYDPCPNVCLEAMAAGIPVIVSRVAGLSEIIEGDSLVVEDPADVDELARAVKRLEDPAARKPMGEAARRKALMFPPERPLEENLKLYAEAAARKSKA